ncbi:MAG: BadF/BadG/BcrA/BcrD ATPase family protein [bacterium]|nr:BadF/BadG/BcrA/BcrD ATPase family protein [bacterium]
MTTYLIGIDGGGTHIRVAICTPDLHIVAQAEGGRANPNGIGLEMAASEIQRTIRAALDQAGLPPDAIRAACVGVAGTQHLGAWLRETTAAVLPNSHIVTAVDLEIALVGALGGAPGVILVSGTGSAAYGLDAAGRSLLVGGWGYLLGDEGSGYWVGTQLLQLYVCTLDGRASWPCRSHFEDALALHGRPALIEWRYQRAEPAHVAALARFALEHADDPQCGAILDAAARELGDLAETVVKRLGLKREHIAFAGGLLDQPNPLSERVQQRLRLPAFPQAHYSPVMGAVLIARQHSTG